MDPKYNDSIVCYKYKRANHDTMEYFFTVSGEGAIGSTDIYKNPSYLNYTYTKKAEGAYQIQMVKNFGIRDNDLYLNNTQYGSTVVSQLDSQKVKYCALQSSQFVAQIFGAGDDTTLFEPITQIGEPRHIFYNEDREDKRLKITWHYYTVRGSDILAEKKSFGNTFKLAISSYVGKHEVYKQ